MRADFGPEFCQSWMMSAGVWPARGHACVNFGRCVAQGSRARCVGQRSCPDVSAEIGRCFNGVWPWADANVMKNQQILNLFGGPRCKRNLRGNSDEGVEGAQQRQRVWVSVCVCGVSFARVPVVRASASAAMVLACVSWGDQIRRKASEARWNGDRSRGEPAPPFLTRPSRPPWSHLHHAFEPCQGAPATPESALSCYAGCTGSSQNQSREWSLVDSLLGFWIMPKYVQPASRDTADLSRVSQISKEGSGTQRGGWSNKASKRTIRLARLLTTPSAR